MKFHGAILDVVITAPPWAAMAVILVEFALVDELLAAQVRRVMNTASETALDMPLRVRSSRRA